MAVSTVLAVKPLRGTRFITGNTAGGIFQSRDCDDFTRLNTLDRWKSGIIRRPKESLHRFVEALQLIAREAFFEAGRCGHLMRKSFIAAELSDWRAAPANHRG